MQLLTEAEILEKIQEIIAGILRISRSEVTIDARLGEDLAMDSLDFVDAVFQMETQFGVKFQQGTLTESLSDLLAPTELEQDGLLTETGAEVLRLRLPEVDPARLRDGQPTVGIESVFTPRTWVRVIKGLLDAWPESCPDCGSDRLTVSKPSVLKCGGCRAEIETLTGSASLAEWVAQLPASLRMTESDGR